MGQKFIRIDGDFLWRRAGLGRTLTRGQETQNGEAPSLSEKLILAIDQGTTSSRALLFDGHARVRGTARRDVAQSYPADGWVEHDAEAIFHDVIACCREVIERTDTPATAIAAIGITNQRETIVAWDRATGRALHPAIVWQDRRTAESCRALTAAGHGPRVEALTGLRLDPYFSATKAAWLLDRLPGLRARAVAGDVCLGTIDSWLIYRLTGGAVHATDATNASRTLLYDLRSGGWSQELLDLFAIPAACLPDVRPSAAHYGQTVAELLGAAIPILGVAGDQQAAALGQACLKPGMVKATFGTGCFALANTGDQPLTSTHRLLSSVGHAGPWGTGYVLEGSIFVAGAAIKWLRDRMGLIVDAADTARLAASVPDDHGVHLVPAFVGLGAPWWDPDARGAIQGLTLDSGPAHIVRASLEAVAFQTVDLLDAMRRDGLPPPPALRVDGGMAANDWLCGFLADVLGLPVERPVSVETTAWGAAFLAGLGAGVFRNLSELETLWQPDRRFEPRMGEARRKALHAGWLQAVARVRSRD